MASEPLSIRVVSCQSLTTWVMLSGPRVSVPPDQAVRRGTSAARLMSMLCTPWPQARRRMEPVRLFSAVLACRMPPWLISRDTMVMSP
ncbi:hypothetical protein D3C72_1156900 [compost metagenome]